MPPKQYEDILKTSDLSNLNSKEKEITKLL